jgi:hypothetical protein
VTRCCGVWRLRHVRAALQGTDSDGGSNQRQFQRLPADIVEPADLHFCISFPPSILAAAAAFL